MDKHGRQETIRTAPVFGPGVQIRCQGSVACSQITAFALTTVLMAHGQRRGIRSGS